MAKGQTYPQLATACLLYLWVKNGQSKSASLTTCTVLAFLLTDGSTALCEGTLKGMDQMSEVLEDDLKLAKAVLLCTVGGRYSLPGCFHYLTHPLKEFRLGGWMGETRRAREGARGTVAVHKSALATYNMEWWGAW
jgi:hypothetical protein